MSRTNSRLNFAPVSSVPSSLVRFAGGYFVFNGVTLGILVILALVAPWFGGPSPAPTFRDGVVLLAVAVSAVGFVWTGTALWRGLRVGGWVMLALAVLPIAAALLAGHRPETITVVFGVIQLVILALVWRELR